MLFVLFVDGHVEDVGELLVREVPDPTFPGCDRHFGEALLLFDDLVDLLLEGIGRNEAVDIDGRLLSDAVGAVRGLSFDGGVPPEVVVNDDGRSRQVETRTRRLERQHHDVFIASILESVHHCLARIRLEAAVDELRATTRFVGNPFLKEHAHLCKLREDEHLAASDLHFLKNVEEAAHLAGKPRILEAARRFEERRRIADLL